MNLWPIAALAGCYALFIALYCSHKIRTRLEAMRGLLDVINIVTALSVFASLYYTVAQFNVTQREQERRDMYTLIQHMTALELEFDMDIAICSAILAGQQNYTNATSSPVNIFHTDMLKHFVLNGVITQERLNELLPEKAAADYVSERRFGVTLFNLHHKMQMMNDLIAANASILNLQVLARIDADVRARTDYRLRSNSVELLRDATEVKTTLTACKPLLVELREKLTSTARQMK